MILESNELNFLVLQDGEDGTPGTSADPNYTWVKYSQNADGTGLTDDPTNAKYIGIAYNKTTKTESTNKTDYAWTLIKGSDGEDGIDAYTIVLQNENISFSTNSSRVPLSTQKHTCEIIVMCGATVRTDFSVGTLTTVNGITTSVSNGIITLSVSTSVAIGADSGSIEVPITIDGKTFKKTISYSVSKAGTNGVAGVSIKTVDVQYYLSTSATALSGGSWSTVAPEWEDGKYIWSKTVTTYSSGNPTESDPVCITGGKGKTGANGTSITIKSTSVMYQVSSSGTTAPTGTWNDTVPTVSAGQYLWTKTVVTYSDNTTTTAYSVSKNGTNGTNGTSVTVKSTSVTYQASSSGTTEPTGTWTSSIPSVSAGQYLWSKTTVTFSDNTSATTYSVSRSGTNGTNGVGVSLTEITYQASSSGTVAPTGTWSSSVPSVSQGQYLWTKTVITYTNGNTSTSYSVGRMGSNGTDGKGISSTSVTYQKSSSGTITPTGTWLTSIPSVNASEYLWTRTVITYTDSTTSTSYSVGMMGAKGDIGATGTGIESITEQYYLSTSKTSQTGSSWKNSPDEWEYGKYMWTRSKIVYKNPTSTEYTTPVCDSSWEAANQVQSNLESEIKTVTETINGVKSEVDENTKSITNKVWQTDITTSINNYDGSTAQAIRDRVTKTESDISGVKTEISDLETTVESKADSSTVQTLINRVATAESTASSFKQTVEATYVTITESAEKLKEAKEYADKSEADAISTAANDATTKANNALTSAKSYTDTSIDDVETEISSVRTIAEQTEEKFSWLVESGTSSTNFTLTDRTATLVSQYINLNGLVSFTGLDSTAQGKITTAQNTADAASKSATTANNVLSNWGYNSNTTYINGGNIYTGTITADQIKTGSITIGKLDSSTQSTISTASTNASNALSNAATAQNTADAASTAASNAQSTATTANNTANTAYSRASYNYGTCSTAASTVAKVVTCSSFPALYTGATIWVKFTYANTAASPTLNVNSTGAKTIYAYGSALTASSAYNWVAGSTVQFIYNGKQWELADSAGLNKAYSAQTTANSAATSAQTANSVIANWCYNNDTTYINGGDIYTGTITSKQLNTDAITSNNYSYSSGNFSTAGAKLDLSNGVFRSKNFAIDSSGNAYFNGSGTFSGAITATSLTLNSGVTIAASKVSGLSTVATSGNYSDLAGKPTIPSLDGYIYENGTVGSTPASGATGFVVSSKGLLKASNAIIYGTLYSSAGTIGGMTLSSNSIYSGTSSMTSTTAGIYLGTGGFRQYKDSTHYVNIANGSITAVGGTISGSTISGTSITGGSINIGNGKFTVSTAGALIATSATITGNVTATTLTATQTGTIGGFTLKDGKLYTNGHSSYNTAADGVYLGSDYIALGNGGKFKVSNTGVLTATDVNISGTIKADYITAEGCYYLTLNDYTAKIIDGTTTFNGNDQSLLIGLFNSNESGYGTYSLSCGFEVDEYRNHDEDDIIGNGAYIAARCDGFIIDGNCDVNGNFVISNPSAVLELNNGASMKISGGGNISCDGTITASNYKDSGWKTLEYASSFTYYNGVTSNKPKYRKVGNVIEVYGIASTTSALEGGSTAGFTMFTLPSGYRPSHIVRVICQGSGVAKWLFTIDTTGTAKFSRYGITDFASVSTSAWLTYEATFLVG